MYVIEDRVTPTVAGYMNLLRTKNIVLSKWPTKWVDSDGLDTTESDPTAVKVFDRLKFYNGNIIDTTNNKKIYHLLGTSVSKLENESYKGISDAYFILKPYKDSYTLTKSDLQNFIYEELPLDEDGYSDFIESTDILFSTEVIGSITTVNNMYGSEESMLELIKDNISSFEFDVNTTNELTALAYLDTDNELFEVSYVINSKQIGRKNNTRAAFGAYVVKANFSIIFRRKISVYDPSVDSYLDKIITKINSINQYSSRLADISNLLVSNIPSINKQLVKIFDIINPIEENDLNIFINDPFVFGKGTKLQNGYLKYEGLKALSPQQFTKILGQSIVTDYDTESAGFWDRLFIGILFISILVIAIATAQPYLIAAETTMLGLAAFASTMAVVLVAGQLTLVFIAKYYADRGMYGAAGLINGSMQVLGMLSTFLSVLSLGANVPADIGEEALKKSFTEYMKDIASKFTFESIKAGLTFAGKSTWEMLTQVTGWLTKGFYVYSNYINPPTDNSDLQKTINEQNKTLEEYATPDNLNKVRRIMDNPYANYLDTNEYMQNIPWLMTEGRVVNATTKYFS